MGIEAVSATLQEETDTLVDVVEPFLLKIGFLMRTAAGRRGRHPPPTSIWGLRCLKNKDLS
ncbi:MAG: Holliday junction DNA helicase RuvB C-terminal domain-containing protein [Desulfobacterales bacterium]